MKTVTNLIIFLIFKLAVAQEVQYVQAESGLIVRAKPDKNSERLGKLLFGTQVKIINETDVNFQVLEGFENIYGKWVKIQEIDGSMSGFVFNGYLASKEVSKKLKIKFNDFWFEMETEVSDYQGELKKIQKDTANIFLGLTESVENKRIKINQVKYKHIAIFQRHENSITVMDSGPHCDLIEWLHYYSEWKKLDFDSNSKTFISDAYNREDYERFIEVNMDQLKKEIETQCGEYWRNLVNDVINVNQYPSSVSVSRIFFKIVLTNQDGSIDEKTISFWVPMGC